MSKSIHQKTTSEQGNSVAMDFICANCGDVHFYEHTLEACCDVNTLNQF